MPTKPLSELQEQIGNSNKTVEDFRIEAGKVEEFARSLRDENPAHRDAEAAAEQGFTHVPAPLTFVRTVYFPRYKPDDMGKDLGFDLGFRPEYRIHGEEAYEFERPLEVGDILTGVTTLVDVYQREGRRGGKMTFAVLETEFRDQTEELVVVSRTTRIETEGAIEREDDDDRRERND